MRWIYALPILLFPWATMSAQQRPMSLMDAISLRVPAGAAVSPDNQWMLYTLSAPDWKEGQSSTDIWMVHLERGAGSARQMTFTKGKNESSPKWSRDGKFFVFASNREAPSSAASQQQLYLMRPDGGEARKITEAKDGVGAFAFSRDGKWLAYSAGKEEERQIWALPVAQIEEAKPLQLTKQKTPIKWWEFSRDSSRVFFLTPTDPDKDNRDRIEKKFTAKLRNQDSPLDHLWMLDGGTKQSTQLTAGSEYSVSGVTLSPDGKWAAFRATPNNRYYRTVTEAGAYSDLYLMEISSRRIERLTDNKDIGESGLRFSPDSQLLAFTAPNDFTYFRDPKVYLRRVSESGGNWRKLGGEHDGPLDTDFWAEDGKTIYFTSGVGAAAQLLALAVDSGKVTQLTEWRGVGSVTRDEDTGRVLIDYADPAAPRDYYTVASLAEAGQRAKWRRLTESNPQVKELALPRTEAVQWKSTDGLRVEGVLVYPVGYEKGKRYPLIVQIHGGPAAASQLTFGAGYGNYSAVYAGAGYFCLLPNYRGSTNYGEKFRMQIAGDYFRQGYEDIMSGVDHLIAQGLVDPDKMGVMGWSAGGHWSNWILTQTDRFKAISSGAGAMNWTSMYAQNDIQRMREHYFGGTPYDNFEAWWNVSPLKYIKNAKTPTLIHVVDGDPRVPRPQSEELHMALKKLGVPTEFLVYPGSTHGIPDARNQYVKMVAEFHWFEKWIKGKDGWFEWKDLLKTLEEPKEKAEAGQETKAEEK